MTVHTRSQTASLSISHQLESDNHHNQMNKSKDESNNFIFTKIIIPPTPPATILRKKRTLDDLNKPSAVKTDNLSQSSAEEEDDDEFQGSPSKYRQSAKVRSKLVTFEDDNNSQDKQKVVLSSNNLHATFDKTTLLSPINNLEMDNQSSSPIAASSSPIKLKSPIQKFRKVLEDKGITTSKISESKNSSPNLQQQQQQQQKSSTKPASKSKIKIQPLPTTPPRQIRNCRNVVAVVDSNIKKGKDFLDKDNPFLDNGTPSNNTALHGTRNTQPIEERESIAYVFRGRKKYIPNPFKKNNPFVSDDDDEEFTFVPRRLFPKVTDSPKNQQQQQQQLRERECKTPPPQSSILNNTQNPLANFEIPKTPKKKTRGIR